MEKRHPNHPGDLSVDSAAAESQREQGELNARAQALTLLLDAKLPFVVGGAYAYATYTGIYRDTKDLDLFPRKTDAVRALSILQKDGWRTERSDEVWIYKAFKGEWYVDLIFNSGNGIAEVDDEWFRYAKAGSIFGRDVLIAPAEELIWSKAFVMERERFDGADVIHLIHSAGKQMSWERIIRRFDRHWEVLLSHLLLYRFTYPSARDSVPEWVMNQLMEGTARTLREGNWTERVCRGNILSAVNYSLDINVWGYRDGKAWEAEQRKKGKGKS